LRRSLLYTDHLRFLPSIPPLLPPSPLSPYTTLFRSEAPLVEMSKAEIIKTAHTLGVPLATTISCYGANAQGEACGKCESCAIRRQGFADAGLVDQTLYA